MKTNAIVRIVLYTLLILILSGILVTFLGLDLFTFDTDTSDPVNSTEASVEAKDVSRLNIEWAAGSITIVTADTDMITFSESGNFADKYTMTYSQKGDKLTIAYAKGNATVSFGSIPSKDLTIIVPQDWVCQELALDGAALEVEINGLTVKEFDIDGAANEIDFSGSVETINCDGAACELNLNCLTKPQKIDLDGASIQMELYIPEECGYLVEMEGLSCSFHSTMSFSGGNGKYSYGDQYCKITADGLSCSITISPAPVVIEVE